jgi:hypothetical protein
MSIDAVIIAVALMILQVIELLSPFMGNWYSIISTSSFREGKIFFIFHFRCTILTLFVTPRPFIILDTTLNAASGDNLVDPGKQPDSPRIGASSSPTQSAVVEVNDQSSMRIEEDVSHETSDTEKTLVSKRPSSGQLSWGVTTPRSFSVF